MFFELDYRLISQTGLKILYPYHPTLYKLYAFTFSTLGIWLWAWGQVRIKSTKLRILSQAFKNAGLESRIGRLPQLISDIAIDPTIRKMRLTNAGFPLSSFNSSSSFVASELGIYIDEIREDRESRAVDIIYSHYSMPEEIKYQDVTKWPYEFLVGQTRAHMLTSSFKDTPHLLVAGQTGGGKSTFLRQLIVHLFKKHNTAKFLLIDLKGGLEFSLFECRKRFSVVPNVMSAVEELKKINQVLDERMSLLKAEKCKDIESYFKKEQKTKTDVNLDRQVIVVDEAAEMFLAGHHAGAKEIQAARGILSRIARQGRAVGVHLVVATQRPDAKSLDPQVKANLTGVVCFQMVNDSSSIAVLGNGRATDLPKIPGRAIWKDGIQMIEVQTPFLSVEEAESLLGEPDDLSQKQSEKVKMENATVTPAPSIIQDQSGLETD